MQRANRHIIGLEFFQGYRSRNREEKVIDVALGVDLIDGIAQNRFDRVAIVGGDGDHLYPIKLAHEKIGGETPCPPCARPAPQRARASTNPVYTLVGGSVP
jgi:hypothetical protein